MRVILFLQIQIGEKILSTEDDCRFQRLRQKKKDWRLSRGKIGNFGHSMPKRKNDRFISFYSYYYQDRVLSHDLASA